MDNLENITPWDIIGVIADIQTSFTENFKVLEKKYPWGPRDARLNVFYSCLELAAHARLSIGVICFAKESGLNNKDWWVKWLAYSPESFRRIDKFDLYVDDKFRQYSHRVREQLLVNTQIYIESFLRNLGRQFSIDEKEFWKLKKKLLEETLSLTPIELEPLVIYQHLKNSLHNKGLHYNTFYPSLEYTLGTYKFYFKHHTVVQLSWQHIRELLIAISLLLLKIIDGLPQVANLSSFDDGNVTILRDPE